MALTGVPWRIHATLARSLANGPGARFVIWTQGCTLACPGCFNPETHRPDAPGYTTAEELAAAVREREHDIEGVTLTGGEPLEQPGAVARFADMITSGTGLGIVISTGFTRREIEGDPAMTRAVQRADMVIAGRYNRQRHLGRGLRGSDNKEYWARTARYRPSDFADIPEVELIIEPDGARVITGLPG